MKCPTNLICETLALTLALGTLACVPPKKGAAGPKAETTGTSTGTNTDTSNDQDFFFGGKPAKISSFNSTLYAQKDACVPIYAEIWDADDATVNADRDVTVSLTSDTPDAAFFGDAKCTTKLTSINIAKGNPDGGFYFKPGTSPNTKITMADSSSGGLEAGSLSVSLANVKALAVPVFDLPNPAGICMALEVVASDEGSHPVFLATNVTVSLQTSSPTGKFFADYECKTETGSITLPAGTAEFTDLYYLDNTVGSPTITATAPSQPSWGKGSGTISIVAPLGPP